MKKILFTLVILLVSISSFSQTTKEQFEKLQKRNHNQYGNRRPSHVLPPIRHDYYYPYQYYPWLYRNPIWDNQPIIVYPPNTQYYRYSPKPKTTKNTDNFLTMGLNMPITADGVGVGIFFAGGNKSFFIFSFDMVGNNPYPYYSNISKWDVMRWNDRYLGREKETYSYSFGGGSKIKNFYPYTTITIVDEQKYLIYFDELYILSSSGRYAIDDDSDMKYGITFGSFYKVNPISLNIYTNTLGQFGVGIGYLF